MSETGRVTGRIDGKKYCELPEGHRTTFIVGMADMLNCLPAALLQYDRLALQLSASSLNRMLEFMGTFESDNLRKLFDEYMSEDAARQNYMVASSFLAMLLKKSGGSEGTKKSTTDLAARPLDRLAAWFVSKNSN